MNDPPVVYLTALPGGNYLTTKPGMLDVTEVGLSPGARKARQDINKMYEDVYYNQWLQMQ